MQPLVHAAAADTFARTSSTLCTPCRRRAALRLAPASIGLPLALQQLLQGALVRGLAARLLVGEVQPVELSASIAGCQRMHGDRLQAAW